MGKAGYLDEGLIKPGDAYAAAFLIPVLVMIIIFIQRGIFPFGEDRYTCGRICIISTLRFFPSFSIN